MNLKFNDLIIISSVFIIIIIMVILIALHLKQT